MSVATEEGATLGAVASREDWIRHDPAAYSPAVTTADVERARSGEPITDPRAVSIGRLFVECRAISRQRGKGIGRSEIESVAAEMVLRIVERRHPIGGVEGALPPRSRFLDPDTGRTSREGRNVLLSALSATLDAPRLWRETPVQEEPTEPGDLPLAQAAQREAVEERREGAVSVDASAEEIARVLDITGDAARVIEAGASFLQEAETRQGRLTWRIDIGAASAAWNVTRETAQVSISRGKKALRDRYPDPADLFSALEAASGAVVEMRADAAGEALEWLRDTGRDLETAQLAASAYVGALEETAPLSPADLERRGHLKTAALLLAATARDGRRRYACRLATNQTAPDVTARKARGTIRGRVNGASVYRYATAREDLAALIRSGAPARIVGTNRGPRYWPMASEMPPRADASKLRKLAEALEV